jgi:Domain of unknown function (DUF1707)
MARHSSLRASDADREAVAERLRQATVEGRLEPDELEERLHATLRARTYGDLHAPLADLPGRRTARTRPRAAVEPPARTAFAVAVRAIAIFVLIATVLAAVALTVAAWVLWALVWLGAAALRRRRSWATASTGAGSRFVP